MIESRTETLSVHFCLYFIHPLFLLFDIVFFSIVHIYSYCIIWIFDSHEHQKVTRYSAVSFAVCWSVFAGWKYLIGWPTSLDKHIKRINEAPRAWRTCKLHDLNNGWADKTSSAIYPNDLSPSSRLSLGFLFPSVRHVSSWFSTAQPVQSLKRQRMLRLTRDQHCKYVVDLYVFAVYDLDIKRNTQNTLYLYTLVNL